MRTAAFWLVVLLLPPIARAQTSPPQSGPTGSPADLRSISQSLKNSPNREVVLPLLPAIYAAVHDEDTASEALPILEQAIETLLPSADARTLNLTANLLKTAARSRFDQGDSAGAAKHLKTLLAQCRTITAQDNSNAGKSQEQNALFEVVIEFLRGDEVGEALAVLGEAVDLGLPWREDAAQSGIAVAGALNRRLQSLSSDEQFELLYSWTMPTKERPSVRVFSSLASVEAPPPAFARALGERPRPAAFPIPTIGSVPGLFSTSATLVAAAADAGQLRKLTSELGTLAEQKTPNAELVLTLAQIATNEGDEQLLASLRARAERLRSAKAKPAERENWTFDLGEIVVAAACTEPKSLIPTGEGILQAAIAWTQGRHSVLLRPFLRQAHAAAIAKRHDTPNLLTDPNLQLWIPAGADNPRVPRGMVRDVWLAHEDHIMHLAGPRSGYLCFRYPLSGEFEFQCEAQHGGPEGTEGNLAFGGLAYETSGDTQTLQVWNLDMGHALQRPCPFIRREAWPAFQRLSLESAKDGVRLVVNGHPMWTDPQTQTNSPWLALRSFSDRIPIFRNPRIVGAPVIPREVRMSDGNLLRGWFSRYYTAEVSLAPAVVDHYAPVANADWFLKDGVIHSAKRERELAAARQSRLSYFRPLQEGESISYEFLYEPGKYEVHPALGRLALMLEPAGVEAHWMTTEDSEWTGLADGNSVVEPLSRRGPRALPLKPGEWNQIALALADGTATLTLNGAESYSRKMEPENPCTFSLYHDRNRSAVQVRNVVMRGDWPERLTTEQLANLVASREPPRTGVERQTRGNLYAERHVPDSAFAVHRAASVMPVERRYEFLRNWVMPGENHPGLRLALDFTPTHPAPPVADQNPPDARRLEIAKAEGRSRVQTGANLVSPAVDLIEAARQLGRLDQLRQQVEQLVAGDDLARRSRFAMLTLISLAKGDFSSSAETLFQLAGLVEAGGHTEFAERWPETLVVFAGLQQPEARNDTRELVSHIYLRQAKSGVDSGSEAWRRQLRSLWGLARHFQSGNSDIESFTSPPDLKHWQVVSRAFSLSRGLGYPSGHWQFADGQVHALSSHDEDYLYFQSPLGGDYEIEADLTAFGDADTQLTVAGWWTEPNDNLKTYTRGFFRRPDKSQQIVPPLTKTSTVLHYRTVVRDGVSTSYVNGRRLHVEPLAASPDPWLAIRCKQNANGAARNLCIRGSPEIPATLDLSTGGDLNGWVTYHNLQGIERYRPDWRRPDDREIFGVHHPELAGSFMESLLRYHRPMLEDGTISYQFYYRPGVFHCHPALDRLAFLLAPEGVRVHWITDGNFERTELAADNVIDEPANRRGPPQLPLRPDAWNQAAVTLRGDTIDVLLNGQVVYQRVLEPTNQRTFGVFHYVDQTEARFRDVSYRGDWPRELPPLAEQELADKSVDFLAERLPALRASFEQDFAAGLPGNRFSIVEGDPRQDFDFVANGLLVRRPGSGDYADTEIAPRLLIGGDFDVIAEYDQLKFEPSGTGGGALLLLLMFNSNPRTEWAIHRRATWKQGGKFEQFYRVASARRERTGSKRYFSDSEAFEAEWGRLRFARRGDMGYFLIAEHDSPNFRLIHTEKIVADRLEANGLRLIARTDRGVTNAVWKRLTVRAEEIVMLSAPGPLQPAAKKS